MKRRLASKHQKLILQCYPPGRAGEKRPNASELSYLLYYVSTRRAKLSKVGVFLEKNNRNDVYRGRQGNVDVTLDIIKALIERCHEDLNLFADHVIAIIYQVMQSNDLALCQHAIQVFGVFCKHHDTAIFNGDSRYATSFCDLSTKIIEVSSVSKGPNELQWQELAVDAAKSVGTSAIITTPRGEKLYSMFIPVVLSNFALDEDGSLFADTKQRLEKLETQRREGRPSMESDDNDDDDESNEEIQIHAAEALRTYFDATGGAQTRLAVRSTIDYLLQRSPPVPWCITLITVVTRWTPVQLRFVVLSSLVDRLSKLSLQDVNGQLLLLELIRALLSSTVSLVGLSVMDILRSLTSQQHAVIGNGGDQASQIVESARTCIASISSHIYYADQLSNMVSDTLSRWKHHHFHESSITREPSSVNLQGMVNGSSAAADHTVDIMVSDLKNVSAILNVSANVNTAGVQMNKVPLHAWEGSQSILSHESSQVRQAYASALLTYLNSGVNDSDKHLKLTKNFSVTHGALGRLVQQLYVIATDRTADRSDYLIAAHILVSLVENLGFNAIFRVLPFTMMIQGVGLSVEHESSHIYQVDQGIALSSIAILVLDSIGRQLKQQDITAHVKSRYERRQAEGTWYRPLDFPLKYELDRDLTQKKALQQDPVDLQITKKSIGVTREDLMNHVVLEGLPEDMIHLLYDEATIADDSAAVTETSESVQGDAIARARSLKALRNGANYTPTVNSQDLANGNGASTAHFDRVGSGWVALRDFSPRVVDLKRVASGILKPDANGFMRSTRNTEMAGSIASTASMRSFSTAEEATTHIPRMEFNDHLDNVNSFLAELSLQSSNERGKLV